MKVQQRVKKRRYFLLCISLFFTTFLNFKTLKKVNYQNISIFGTESLSIEDILANSSLNLPTPLIFVNTTYTEKELKKNLSLENVSVSRQIFPFGLKILIQTRTPIAYGERILNGKKITGFIDKEGFFINQKYVDKENVKQLTSKVYGWKENFKKTLSSILDSQVKDDIEFTTINFSPNGYLTLQEKDLKTILMGFNAKIIETQLQIIKDMKTQIKGENILEKIDNVDLTDPSNPKIKVFKP